MPCHKNLVFPRTPQAEPVSS
uniref:Uncharacterized protein n=1 Tax=Arundo donax TaxID=35708 RepID=A0A0A9EDA5_ARUDO